MHEAIGQDVEVTFVPYGFAEVAISSIISSIIFINSILDLGILLS